MGWRKFYCLIWNRYSLMFLFLLCFISWGSRFDGLWGLWVLHFWALTFAFYLGFMVLFVFLWDHRILSIHVSIHYSIFHCSAQLYDI